MLDRDSHEGLDQLAELDLARHRLRGLDHGVEVQVLDGRTDHRGRRSASRFLAQPRVALLELPHLAQRAPAKIVVARVAQVGVGDGLKAARRVEARGQLMGQAFVLDETAFVSRSNGVFVPAHGVGVSSFKARDLGRHQCVLVAESGWIVVGPLAQLLKVGRQDVVPLGLLVAGGVLVERRDRQCRVVRVVEQIDLEGFPPKHRFRLARSRQSLGVVA